MENSYLVLLLDCHQFEMLPKHRDLYEKIRYTHVVEDLVNALDSNVGAQNQVQNETLALPSAMDWDLLESQLVLLKICKLGSIIRFFSSRKMENQTFNIDSFRGIFFYLTKPVCQLNVVWMIILILAFFTYLVEPTVVLLLSFFDLHAAGAEYDNN